jgi:FkbM family methyltransferase
MFKYLKSSFSRKIARRVTKEYPEKMYAFDLEGFGKIEFANWENPLVPQYQITKGMVAFFNQFIKGGDLCVDIGSNIGDLTVPMAIAAGKDGVALAFDPSPYVFKILEKNASLNKALTNIIPVQCAISQEEERFYYISSEASFSNGAISKTKKSPHGKYVYPTMIEGVNLENFIKEKYSDKFEKLTFIKIDTEGYDKEIIKSIAGLILKTKPVIVAESFGGATTEEKLDLYHTIASLGYTLYYLEDFEITAERKLLRNPNDILDWEETINVLAIPN